MARGFVICCRICSGCLQGCLLGPGRFAGRLRDLGFLFVTVVTVLYLCVSFNVTWKSMSRLSHVERLSVEWGLR